MFFLVLNHVEAVSVTRLMACAMPAASAREAAALGRAARKTSGGWDLGLRSAPTHQNGESITRMVITNLVRPDARQKRGETPAKTRFSARKAVLRASLPLVGPSMAPSHIPPVRSRSELVPLGPPGRASFVRFCRSSTNPDPRAGRERSFVPA